MAGIECLGYEKAPLKSIVGSEFYLCKQLATERTKENRSLSHLVVLAKNRDGWRNLIKATSEANRPEHFYHKPRLDLARLASFAGNQWVVFSGHPGSDLANVCFGDPRAAYSATSYEEAKSYTKPWKELQADVLEMAGRYQDLFGKENFFLEVQLIDAENMPAAQIIAKIMRWASKQTGIECVATPDAHYPSSDDAGDQRVLLCSAIDTTLREVHQKLAANEEVGLGGFFRSNRYHIPSPTEMTAIHEPDELNTTLKIADMCEAFDISHKPRLPAFECPGGINPNDYLKQLCREGWKRKVLTKIPKDQHQTYKERVEKELGVLQEAGLAPYFLIVWDYCRYAQQILKCKTPRGRGSAAGSLVSHLLNITDCDPIEHQLLFERFYNSGRNTKDRVALPDIDCDFPISKREQVITYIRQKYGDGRVSQMATFGRMQGREALTAVFRAHDWGTFEQRKEITAHVPDEAAISDELQEMREETGEASIIRWALENEAEALSEYCVLEKDDSLSGPLARYFSQAIRLEGSKRSQGKHAAGIIISPVDLAEECPMLYDKSSDLMVAGFEMYDVEALGLTKMDVLGLAVLDKIQGTVATLRTGRVGVF